MVKDTWFLLYNAVVAVIALILLIYSSVQENTNGMIGSGIMLLFFYQTLLWTASRHDQDS